MRASSIGDCRFTVCRDCVKAFVHSALFVQLFHIILLVSQAFFVVLLGYH